MRHTKPAIGALRSFQAAAGSQQVTTQSSRSVEEIRRQESVTRRLQWMRLRVLSEMLCLLPNVTGMSEVRARPRAVV